jgi:transposase
VGHRHSDEFRREAVRIALTSELTRRQVVADSAIGFSTLSKWIQLERRDEVLSAPQEDQAKENDRLRREVRLLKEERNLLKNCPGLWPACAR